MKTVQLREAKATLSALVDAAEHGEATTITRHGKPAAVLVPIEQAAELLQKARPSFADLLLAYPGGLEFERTGGAMRDVDL
ncbi:MAG TPA: type II toxin-antitoxin system Phd/YefM family antitoxin [Rhodoblastus sp.]|nr:type II toxin-antitoxin system Phd/YefM family antitoxin [Rhodoblastus sp.]